MLLPNWKSNNCMRSNTEKFNIERMNNLMEYKKLCHILGTLILFSPTLFPFLFFTQIFSICKWYIWQKILWVPSKCEIIMVLSNHSFSNIAIGWRAITIRRAIQKEAINKSTYQHKKKQRGQSQSWKCDN